MSADNIYISLSGYTPHKSVLSRDELIDNLNRTLSFLQNISSSNLQAEDDLNKTGSLDNRKIYIDWHKRCKQYILMPGVYRHLVIEPSKISELIRIFNIKIQLEISKQIHLIGMLNSKTELIGSIGLWLSSQDSLHDLKLIDGFECANCKEVVVPKMALRHLGSLKCRVRTIIASGTDRGLVQIHGFYAHAVRQANIQHEIHPKELAMWTEPWVAQAIDFYNSTPDYAGLNMIEYLIKMKPK